MFTTSGGAAAHQDFEHRVSVGVHRYVHQPVQPEVLHWQAYLGW